MKSIVVLISVLFIYTAAYAGEPANPSFEDLPDLVDWAVLDIGGDPGGAWVVRGGDATDGDAFGSTGLYAMYAYGATVYGPALQSGIFSGVAGEVLSVDWRVAADGGGGCGAGDPSTGDTGLGRGYLFDAAADPAIDLPVATFFDVGPVC